MSAETTTTTETTETAKPGLFDNPLVINFLIFGAFGLVFAIVMAIMFLDMVKLM